MPCGSHAAYMQPWCRTSTQSCWRLQPFVQVCSHPLAACRGGANLAHCASPCGQTVFTPGGMCAIQILGARTQVFSQWPHQVFWASEQLSRARRLQQHLLLLLLASASDSAVRAILWHADASRTALMKLSWLGITAYAASSTTLALQRTALFMHTYRSVMQPCLCGTTL